MTTNRTAVTINIARQFSRFPAGRYRADGPYSGEEFRERLLRPALQNGADLIIDLDGTVGFGSSFLEEAFGGLARAGFSREELRRRIRFTSEDPSLIEEVSGYIEMR